MIDLRETLPLLITYDHAAGVWWAALPSGARFPIERQHIGGKLENALTLFKKQVISHQSGKYVQKRGADGVLRYEYDESQVKRYSARGREITDLQLDIGELIL